MSLALSSIDKNIKDTLVKREQTVDSVRDGWFNKRTPWIRLTSLASVGGDDDFRKNWILFGGTSAASNKIPDDFYSIYTINSSNYSYIAEKKEEDYPLQHELEPELFIKKQKTLKKSSGLKFKPIPGVTQVEVKNKGSWGAVREAVISFVCWDMNQLNVLEHLYMTPGISLLLEWGWSVTIDGNPIRDNLSADPPNTDNEISKTASELVKKSKGHYDAMQGLITDFNWTMRDDGGYDCSTTIASMAETFLETNIHNKSGVDGVISVDDTSEFSLLDENISSVINKLQDEDEVVINDIVYATRIKYKNIDFKKEQKEKRRLFNKEEDTEKQKELSKGSDRGSFFVTWEFIEKYLINESLGYKTKKEVAPIIPRMDSDAVWINIRKNILSADPMVCILPDAEFLILKSRPKFLAVTPALRIAAYTYADIFDVDQRITAKFYDKTKPNKIKFNQILVNILFVQECYLNSETLSEFIMKMLNGISDSCGKLWNFQLMIDEEEPEVIYVIDVKTTEGRPTLYHQFKVYDQSSVVKSVSFNTEIDQKIKAMIMYGTNRNHETSGDVGEESTYGYKLYGTSITNLSYGTLEPASPSAELQSADKKSSDKSKEMSTEESLFLILDSIIKFKGKWTRNPKNVEKLKSALNKYILDETRDEQNKLYGDVAFPVLPVKLNVSVDGISGIRFGNVIDIDYKPDRYDGTCFFQVTNVIHSISPETWDTTFETVMRVDTESL